MNDHENKSSFIQAQSKLLKKFKIDYESRFIHVPAVSGQAHVLVTGKGPPVILVPGFGDPAAMWAPLLAKLSGYTLYAVDRPCFGLTDYIKQDTNTFRSLAVQFLEQVLNKLELTKAAFIGNSIGSLWTFWLSIAHPDRVASMTHIGCPAFILGTSAPFPMRLISLPGVGKFIMNLSPPSDKQVKKFAKMVGVDLSDLDELTRLLVTMQKMPKVKKAIPELLHTVVRLRGARPQVAFNKDDLEQIRQPVQFIWGEKDPFGSVEIGKRSSAIIPDSEFHLIPGTGHAPWINHTEAVAKLTLSFLQEKARPS
ncbi:MAG: alpha/beta hydrolase [Calditrichia bacterium]